MAHAPAEIFPQFVAMVQGAVNASFRAEGFITQGNRNIHGIRFGRIPRRWRDQQFDLLYIFGAQVLKTHSHRRGIKFHQYAVDDVTDIPFAAAPKSSIFSLFMI